MEEQKDKRWQASVCSCQGGKHCVSLELLTCLSGGNQDHGIGLGCVCMCVCVTPSKDTSDLHILCASTILRDPRNSPGLQPRFHLLSAVLTPSPALCWNIDQGLCSFSGLGVLSAPQVGHIGTPPAVQWSLMRCMPIDGWSFPAPSHACDATLCAKPEVKQQSQERVWKRPLYTDLYENRDLCSSLFSVHEQSPRRMLWFRVRGLPSTGAALRRRVQEKGAARHKAGQRKQGSDLTPQVKHRKAFLGVLGVAVLLSS